MQNPARGIRFSKQKDKTKGVWELTNGEFTELMQQYQRLIYTVCLQFVHDPHTAEEITQEAFYKAMTHLDRFDGRCRLYVWLCQIAKNTYLTYARRQRRHAPAPEGDGPSQPGFEDEVLDRGSAWELHKRLHQMREPYKEVFSLRVFGELSFSQIGQLFGKTDSWARLIFYRAKTELRRQADENDL